MAALSEAPTLDLLDLRHVAAEDLEPVLREEAETWRTQLQWDFEPSADLVRRFVRMHALQGVALATHGKPVGYAYYVCEGHKGLLGALFIAPRHATPEAESRLLSGALQRLMQTPGVTRIEAQLMMLRPRPAPDFPFAPFLRTYPRRFMVCDLRQAWRLTPRRANDTVAFGPWSEHRQEEAAQLIAGAYASHVDSQINDQYRSVSGARRFLQNIVEYPGCGRFYPTASQLAVLPGSGRLCGLCLGSVVASDVGHVTQICVTPGMQGHGVGYELLRRALVSLARNGHRAASLTVTASNVAAVQLYERMGFRTHRQFSAMVWEGFGR